MYAILVLSPSLQFSPYAHHKGADQSLNAHSLIGVLVVFSMDNVMSQVSEPEISNLQLVCVAEEVCFGIT